LAECQVPALVMSTFHLMRQPGTTVVAAAGDLHEFCGWHRPIMTDSGGFQIYSMVRQNSRYGSIGERGVLFRPEDGHKKLLLTPEKSIQAQLRCGADILVCLDDCTHPDDSLDTQRASVERTVRWAQRSRKEFDRITTDKNREAGVRPLLYAVVQGGSSEPLRRECAQRLLEVGFDGYGFGGWPIDSEGNLVTDSLALTRSLVPEEYPMHALGVGHPVNIISAWNLGYDLFDSSLPTRDARNGRLYVVRESMIRDGRRDTEVFARRYIQDERHVRATAPVDESCDCLCCATYDLAYLHHLHTVGDVLFQRLATIHNLRAMVRLMRALRNSHR
jgi:queuine tRNA-ribosyltransferase